MKIGHGHGHGHGHARHSLCGMVVSRRLSSLIFQRWLLAFIERPPRIVALAVLLLLPCAATGLALDDYVLALKSQAATVLPALPSQPLELFTFTTGDPAQNARLMDEAALLPWWSDPQHLNAFFRPLSALTHLLDFRLWPSWPTLMHLHSLVWYALLLIVLGYVYRTLEPAAPLACGFALLLYAIDDAHGATVGWIANRNALLSATLALPALAAHHRALTARGPGWVAPLWFAQGLCAGESAFCVLGYLVAYALHVDQRSRRQRLVSLAPYVLLFLAHRAFYHTLGLGSFGSAAYHEPLREPGAFLAALSFNLPVLLSAQLFFPLADLGFWGDSGLRLPLWLISVLSLLVCAYYGAGLWRRERMVRFWATGMLLAAATVSASLPGERLLLAVGFGAAPLIARVLLEADILGPSVMPHGARRGFVSALVALHMLAAPLLLPLRACAYHVVASAAARLDRSLSTAASITGQSVVVLNAPMNILLSYLQIARAWRGEPRPAHLYWLSTASSETLVTRTASDELLVQQAQGFMFRPEDTHYRADLRGLTRSAELSRPGMTIQIADSLPDGRPASVRFRFAAPLEAAQYDFRIYRDGELVPWSPGAVGQSVSLPAVDFGQLLLAEVRRW
jgi:hypothetical protein